MIAYEAAVPQQIGVPIQLLRRLAMRIEILLKTPQVALADLVLIATSLPVVPISGRHRCQAERAGKRQNS
jgi:hypothetical protein